MERRVGKDLQSVNICLCLWLKLYSCSRGIFLSFSLAVEELSRSGAQHVNFELTGDGVR